MSISEELQRLDELRRNGALSQSEFELAKQKVLQSPDNIEATEHLGEIRAQNEVAQLDREWDLQRKNYLMTGKYGNQSMPTKTGSVFGGVLVTAFCIFWVVTAGAITSSGPPGISSLFPLFGILFGLFAVTRCIQGFNKASQFEKAQKIYQRRRNQLLHENSRS